MLHSCSLAGQPIRLTERQGEREGEYSDDRHVVVINQSRVSFCILLHCTGN